LLGELEVDSRVVISDLEAGVGTLVRMQPGQADVVLVIVEPSAKSVEAARRACDIADSRSRVVLVANRIVDDTDLERIRGVLGDREMVVVPDDPAITKADRDGLAPIDAAPDSPGVAAIVSLARRIAEPAAHA
jgi:CO dehydrogenase nickel-insertion accessory protein CooC1